MGRGSGILVLQHNCAAGKQMVETLLETAVSMGATGGVGRQKMFLV
jgi:hypothetical protein